MLQEKTHSFRRDFANEAVGRFYEGRAVSRLLEHGSPAWGCITEPPRPINLILNRIGLFRSATKIWPIACEIRTDLVSGTKIPARSIFARFGAISLAERLPKLRNLIFFPSCLFILDLSSCPGSFRPRNTLELLLRFCVALMLHIFLV